MGDGGVERGGGGIDGGPGQEFLQARDASNYTEGLNANELRRCDVLVNEELCDVRPDINEWRSCLQRAIMRGAEIELVVVGTRQCDIIARVPHLEKPPILTTT